MRRNRTDLGFEITSAFTNSMGNSSTEVMDMSRHSLESGSRRAYQPNWSPSDVVGKSKAHSIDDCRAAIRSHYEQTFLACSFLQCNFILERNIVTVKENVFAKFERFTGDVCSITTRD